MTYFQSLWKQKTWNQHPIKANVAIIGYLQENSPCPADFANSCTMCSFPNTNNSTENKPQDGKINAEVSQHSPENAIHCYLSPLANWEEKLLANFKFEQDGIKKTSGVLVQAIKKNKPLIIHNPPNDPQLHKLLQQIKTEGRFYFNGQWNNVPKTTSIQIVSENTAPLSMDSIHFVTDEQKNSDAEKICMHLNNWDTLYEEIDYLQKFAARQGN